MADIFKFLFNKMNRSRAKSRRYRDYRKERFEDSLPASVISNISVSVVPISSVSGVLALANLIVFVMPIPTFSVVVIPTYMFSVSVAHDLSSYVESTESRDRWKKYREDCDRFSVESRR